MTGRQRGGFIQEEQLRVMARRHQVALSALEFEQADNPARALELTSDVLLVVVQATTITSQRPSCRRGNNGTERRYAILSRHSAPLQAA
jgi:hypothetical protein